VARRKPRYTCGRPTKTTKNHRPCRKGVAQAGQACKDHRGLPILSGPVRRQREPKTVARRSSSTPRSLRGSSNRRRTAGTTLPPRPPSRGPGEQAKRDERLVKEAVLLVRKTYGIGAHDALADRIAEHIGEKLWSQLLSDWRPRRCRELARCARYLLRVKSMAHGAVAQLAYWLVKRVTTSGVVRLVVQELARSLRIPVVDEHLASMARALQLMGIYACVVQGLELADCECLRDVVNEEGKERLKKLLVASYEDWRELHQV